jgi:simple sugar transport system substrate-binding protein
MPRKVVAALTANPDVDGILTLGPTGSARPWPPWKPKDCWRDPLATLTFSGSARSRRDGNMLFAIDQQQYIQGYLPIVPDLYNENLNTIANDVLDRPGFVTPGDGGARHRIGHAGTR